MYFGIIGIAKEMIPWFFGSEYEDVTDILPILSLLVIVIGLSSILGIQYMIPIKRQKEYNISIIFGAVINIILNFLLIPSMYSIGAAIASVAAETGICICMILYIKKEISFFRILKKTIIYIFASVLMYIVIRYIGINLGSGVHTTIAQILVGMGIYFGMLYVLKDEILIDNARRLMKKFKGA